MEMLWADRQLHFGIKKVYYSPLCTEISNWTSNPVEKKLKHLKKWEQIGKSVILNYCLQLLLQQFVDIQNISGMTTNALCVGLLTWFFQTNVHLSNLEKKKGLIDWKEPPLPRIKYGMIYTAE